jgi:hypothetical protein
LVSEFLRDHAGQMVAVSDIMPLAVGSRTPNAAEYRNIEIVVYEALKRLVKRGTASQVGAGAKTARFTLT